MMILKRKFRSIILLIRASGINVTSHDRYFAAFLKLYAAVWFVFVSACAVVSFVYCKELRLNMMGAAHEVVRYRSTITVMYASYLLMTVSSIKYSREFGWAFRNLAATDKSLSRRGLQVKYTPDVFVYVRLAAFLGVGIVGFIHHTHFSVVNAADWFLTVGTAFSVCGSHCHFYAVMKLISDHLDFIIAKMEDTFVHLPYEGGISKMIALMEAHDSVLKTAAVLEDAYCFPSLVTSAGVFILLVSRVYFLSTDLTTPYFPDIYISAYRLVELYTIVSASTSVLNKEDNYQHCVYAHLMEDREGLVINNNKVRILRLHSLTLRFTACGFFKIDHALMATICGAVFSFVIILLQLD